MKDTNFPRRVPVNTFVKALSLSVVCLFLGSCGKTEAPTPVAVVETIDKPAFELFKQSMTEKMNHNQVMIHQQKKLIDANNASHLDTLNRLDNNLSAVTKAQAAQQNQITALVTRLEKLAVQQENLSNEFDQVALSVKQSLTKKNKQTELNIVIKSIVLWGEDYVIHAINDQDVITLRVNDRMGDWLVINIDYPAKQVAFRHLKTKKITHRVIP